MKISAENTLNHTIAERGAAFAVLLDPDSLDQKAFVESGIRAAEGGADILLLGGSFLGNPAFSAMTAELKQKIDLPLVLFPGGGLHVMPGPDAILFTSLISGRNSQYLIDEQVKGAVLVKKLGIEPIPTAYILIDGGKTTAVEFISNTRPIPADKPKLTMVHALAAEMMGMRWIYLEAGSGALNPVPCDHIALVSNICTCPVIVGGGLTTAEMAHERVLAGAKVIVTGNFWERCHDISKIREFADAVHTK